MTRPNKNNWIQRKKFNIQTPTSTTGRITRSQRLAALKTVQPKAALPRGEETVQDIKQIGTAVKSRFKESAVKFGEIDESIARDYATYLWTGQKKKISSGKKAGADYLCSACPYCHLQFDVVQQMIVSQNGNNPLASVLYPQLLGLCMGIDEKTLGIGMNQIDISGVTSFLESGEENAE